ETIHRDRSGRKVDLAAQRAELAAKRREREAREEANMEWGRGFVQTRDAEARKARLDAEADRPLAVYADDRERNEELKGVDRWGDPMAALVAKNKAGKGKPRPVYKGPPAAPNRFGILPGYRWDGVDRSNGAEAAMFSKKNERATDALAAYKWSTE
ncbi:hypothetical protein BDK51DRAFT_2994, partial [Blyttiomyces helicus]